MGDTILALFFFVFSCFYQNLGQKEFFRPKEKEEEK
jgi:hypothetical protein